MKIARDKWKHFYVGVAMGAVLQAGATWLFPGRIYFATGLAFAVVVIISYGFELFSKFTGKGHYELMDAVAAVIGGVLGMAAAWGVFALQLGHA